MIPVNWAGDQGYSNEPRQLIGKMANLVRASEEKNMSICCGGSLGSTGISCYQRDEVSMLTLETLTG